MQVPSGAEPGVLEQAEVILHRRGHGAVVAAAHRLEERPVRRDGGLERDARVHPRRTGDRQVSRERGHERDDERVVRRPCELEVEAGVELGDARPVVERILLLLEQPFERAEVGLRGDARRQARHGRLESRRASSTAGTSFSTHLRLRDE